ncbi:MAG: hypothetical protein ABEI13_04595 [Candidatus Paceibacteria bacterium]
MPGHAGNKKVSLKNRRVVDVYPDENIILIKGSLPGADETVLKLSSV